MNTVPEIWHVMGVIVIFHFGLFFALLSLYKPKNQNFLKKLKKTSGGIIILHMSTKNYGKMMYGSWDMVCNREMDRRKKWHIEVGAQPKNVEFKRLLREVDWTKVTTSHNVNHAYDEFLKIFTRIYGIHL